MEYFETPQKIKTKLPTVFLAGGITGCPDWQSEAAQLFAGDEVAVINPRRQARAMGFSPSVAYVPASGQQVAWEFEALSTADLVMFWFPASVSLQPMALYELGRCAAISKWLVVGCDPGYPCRQHVQTHMALARPGLPIYDRLGDAVAAVRQVEL